MVKRSKNDADALDHTVAAIEGLLCAPDYMTCNCELDGDMLREEEEEENKYLASFLPMGVAGETQQEARRLSSLADRDEPEDTLPDDQSQESGGESEPEDQVADEPAPVTHIEEDQPPKQAKAQKRRFRFGGFGRRFGKKKA